MSICFLDWCLHETAIILMKCKKIFFKLEQSFDNCDYWFNYYRAVLIVSCKSYLVYWLLNIMDFDMSCPNFLVLLEIYQHRKEIKP